MIGGGREGGGTTVMKTVGQLPDREFGIVIVCLSNGLKGNTVKASGTPNHRGLQITAEYEN